MFKHKLLTLAASSILMTAVAGVASNQESDADIVSMKTDADMQNVSGDKSARFNVEQDTSRSSSSSAYSLHSAEMLNKKRETVYFDFDSAKLDSESEIKLQQLPDIENYQAKSVMIKVSGHADAIGPDAYNQLLSRQRAETVRDAIKATVPAAVTIDVLAQGEDEPVAPNDSAYGRSKNRRVEITYFAQ